MTAAPPDAQHQQRTPPVTPAAVGDTRRRLRDPRVLIGYLYVAPALLLVAGVIYYSIWYDGSVSLTNWNGLDPDRVFVGFANYRRAWDDPVMRSVLEHTFLFGLVTIPVQALLGFWLACVINSRVRLKMLYRAIIFIPSVLAPAVIAQTAQYFLAPDGWLDGMLRWVGLGQWAHPWLAQPDTALWALMGVNIWEWTGFSFLLYLAGLTLIDRSLLEAAAIDGARSGTLMWRIAFPLCRSTHIALVILGTISTLKLFDIIYLTTVGGPGTSTQVFSTYIYQQSISNFEAGYATALSIILLVVALVVTVVQMSVFRRLERW